MEPDDEITPEMIEPWGRADLTDKMIDAGVDELGLHVVLEADARRIVRRVLLASLGAARHQ